MKTLKKGDYGSEVHTLQDMLNRVHCPAGKVDGIFGSITEAAVREYERRQKLPVDGVADPAVWAELEADLAEAGPYMDTVVDTLQEVQAKYAAVLPVRVIDHRVSQWVHDQQLCDGGQGARYGGWKNPYKMDSTEFDTDKKFRLPLVGKIVLGAKLMPTVHGGTCSPWAGLMLGCYLCANESFDFRVGRSGQRITEWKSSRVNKKGQKEGGFGEYCEVEGVRRLVHNPLNTLYKYWDWLNWVNVVEMDHHVILILKVGYPDGLALAHPMDPAVPLPTGLYRWAADGFYVTRGDVEYYSGTRQTFRLITEIEKCSQAWDVYRVKNVDPVTCSPLTGPFAGRDPWPMILE